MKSPFSFPASTDTGVPRPPRLVSRRAVLLGLVLVPLNTYWMMVAELRWYLILSLNPLFVTPIFFLFFLVLLNFVLKRWTPRYAFTPAELLTVYIMLVLSCTVATHDYIINLMSMIGWPEWFAESVNQWEKIMFPHLPKHLLVWNHETLRGYFEGRNDLYRRSILLPWFSPLAWWTAFVLISFFVMFCLNVLLRKAWLEHIKLTFPIVQLPLRMAAPDAARTFFRSRAMWIGFGLAAAIDLLNGFHQLYPVVPGIQIRARFLQIVDRPLSVLNGQPLSLYPFAVGLGFLVPLDVSFSCWFFYLFARMQYVFGFMTGKLGLPGYPFHPEQAIGAWIVYAAMLVYGARRHLKQVFATALPPWVLKWWRTGVLKRGPPAASCSDREPPHTPPAADDDEPLRYRWALLGATGGLAFLIWFWMRAGMSLLPAVVSVLIYFMLSFCITRARAEAGGQHTVWDLEPKNLFMLFDSRTLGPHNLAAASVSHWFWRLNRSHHMPAQLESFKIGQEHRIPTRQLALPMLLAVLVAVPSAMWAFLHIVYREGALGKCQGYAMWTGIESFGWLDNALKNGFRVEPNRWYAVAGSIGFTSILAVMKMRFLWWPFHPLGYCIGPGLIWTWFPFLLAWASKALILRYGGNDGYRKAVPFFMGLILGDYITGALWSIYGGTRHVLAYQIFH
ncbi:MAG: hypothetical protein HY318_02980 [Armatimonadetes bacterium]|nr:hypothetical protein [Armatimonadota bacterium]